MNKKIKNKNQFLSIRFSIDINVSDYIFVHFNLINQICNQLNFESISISKLK